MVRGSSADDVGCTRQGRGRTFDIAADEVSGRWGRPATSACWGGVLGGCHCAVLRSTSSHLSGQQVGEGYEEEAKRTDAAATRLDSPPSHRLALGEPAWQHLSASVQSHRHAAQTLPARVLPPPPSLPPLSQHLPGNDEHRLALAPASAAAAPHARPPPRRQSQTHLRRRRRRRKGAPLPPVPSP